MAIRQQNDKDLNFTIDLRLADGITPANVANIATDITIQSITHIRGSVETQWDVTNVLADQNPGDPVGRYNILLTVANFDVPLEDDDKVEFIGTATLPTGSTPFREEFVVYEPGADEENVPTLISPLTLVPDGTNVLPDLVVQMSNKDVDLVANTPTRRTHRLLIREDGTQVDLFDDPYTLTASVVDGMYTLTTTDLIDDATGDPVIPAVGDKLVVEVADGPFTIPFEAPVTAAPIVI